MSRAKNQEKVLVIAGPTAAGKTAASLKIARDIDGEIISADSMQVYRYMDIGTAKPSVAERNLVAHHMIDVVNPDEDFNAGVYAEKARAAIAAIYARKKAVIICGGTGLYLRALLHGLCEAPSSDSRLRSELKHIASSQGLDVLYRRLSEVDPEAASQISPNDSSRIIRALEVSELTGRPLSRLQKRHGFRQQNYQVMWICLSPVREELYRRIETRTDRMITEGLVEEVRGLYEKGFSRDLKSMQSLGYRQIGAYLAGEISLDRAVDEIKRDTRRFAKRQLTWFKREQNAFWILDINEYGVRDKIEAFISE